jgi:hypothetical protein
MTLLGTLLKNRRSGDTHSPWNLPNLQGPERLTVTSRHFEEGELIPPEHAGKRIGGKNLSPHLTWSPPPPETTELLLVVEDLDVPMSKPAVHCLVLIDPSRLDSPNHLPQGALSAHEPAAGVRVLRSTIGRGYHDPNRLRAMDRTDTPSKSSLSRAKRSASLTERDWIEQDPAPFSPLLPHQ